ncbi:unnamed protein product [Pleuronectes platessa]|uniref:Uncharacterized protein n=1 Tax=Pleuronectes platessa TaxID=8262 RepID=A0A9N7W412_PLEPL|nr:unnamed protein product [Pleuronectes platessa]
MERERDRENKASGADVIAERCLRYEPVSTQWYETEVTLRDGNGSCWLSSRWENEEPRGFVTSRPQVRESSKGALKHQTV